MDRADGNMGRTRWTERMRKSAVTNFFFFLSFLGLSFVLILCFIFYFLLLRLTQLKVILLFIISPTLLFFELACHSTPWLVREGESVTGTDTFTDIQPLQPHSLFSILFTIVYFFILLPFTITKVPCYFTIERGPVYLSEPKG